MIETFFMSLRDTLKFVQTFREQEFPMFLEAYIINTKIGLRQVRFNLVHRDGIDWKEEEGAGSR
jgi:hypothetical protein